MKASRIHPDFRPWAALTAAVVLSGCTTDRVTEPPETANEQLLVTTAVDHAVAGLKLPIAPGSKIFVDSQFFDADANIVMPKYTIAAVRDLILRSGGDLVDDRKSADQVAELRNGAQAIDHHTLLIGIPAISLPVPLVGPTTTPELALYKSDKQRGVSKVALTLYSAKTGALADSTGPTYGDSHDTDTTILLLFGGESKDTEPPPSR